MCLEWNLGQLNAVSTKSVSRSTDTSTGNFFEARHVLCDPSMNSWIHVQGCLQLTSIVLAVQGCLQLTSIVLAGLDTDWNCGSSLNSHSTVHDFESGQELGSSSTMLSIAVQFRIEQSIQRFLEYSIKSLFQFSFKTFGQNLNVFSRVFDHISSRNLKCYWSHLKNAWTRIQISPFFKARMERHFNRTFKEPFIDSLKEGFNCIFWKARMERHFNRTFKEPFIDSLKEGFNCI
jgi:hypothetical protein